MRILIWLAHCFGRAMLRFRLRGMTTPDRFEDAPHMTESEIRRRATAAEEQSARRNGLG